MIEYVRNSKAHIFQDQLDDTIDVVGEDFHHLSRVIRLRENEKITAAKDGQIREYNVVSITRDDIKAVAIRETQLVEEPEINLLVSLFKMDRLEIGIAKAVELGATQIIVGSSERSSILLDAKKLEKAQRRIEAIVRNSAMQSRRAQLTKVLFVDNIIDYAQQLDQPLIICEPSGTNQVVRSGTFILIGPEGGFSTDELDSLSGKSSLWNVSPYILRAETAMMVVPALINTNP